MADIEKMILVQDLGAPDVVELAVSQGYNHTVQKARPETNREMTAAQLLNRHPDIFFEFPISSTLRPESAGETEEKSLSLGEWKCSTIADKDLTLNLIEELFVSNEFNESLKDDVILAASEFICNALFNAPCDDGVNTRTLEKTLKDAEKEIEPAATIRLGTHDGYLALSCRDGFGTLDPSRILERLKSCLSHGVGESINFFDRGSAGIGCYLIFNACTSFFMVVRSGKSTQFCAVFPLKSGARARNEMPKNLHWVKI